MAVEDTPLCPAILRGVQDLPPVARGMNGLLQILLFTDQTLSELAAARRQEPAELDDLLREALGEEHADLVRSLAAAEARCAELAEALAVARAERHRYRREMAVAAIGAAPLPPLVGA